MRSLLRIESSSRTDPGRVRPVNEDALQYREPDDPVVRIEKGSIWAIADGVGPDGLAASRLAATSVVDAYWHSAIPDQTARLRSAVERTNTLLASQNAVAQTGQQSGATILAAAIVGDQLIVANAGRSRAYIVRGDAVRQITNDHTWVAEQIRSGLLDPAAATTHPQRNVITRCLGVMETMEIDLFTESLTPGDVVVLCSDGLHRELSDDIIARHARQSRAAASSVLVDEARHHGGRDNITVVTLAVDPELQDTAPIDQIALLNRLSRELTASLDFGRTIESVTRRLAEYAGGERAAIFLCDDDGALSTVVAHPPDEEASGSTERLREVAEEAMRERRPALSASGTRPLHEARGAPVARSIVCIPLIAKDETIGVMAVDAAINQNTDLDLLVAFAGQAAAAIENARLHERLVRQTRELELTRKRDESLIRSLSSSLIAIDNNQTITHWNPAAEEALGIRADIAVGESLRDILPSPIAAWLSGLVVQAQLDSATILLGHEWEGQIGARDRVVLAGRVAQIRDPEGETQGYVFVLNDRTETVMIDEARRRESAERERIRDLFRRYLAPAVAEQLLSRPDALQLGGTRRDVTIMFADVRGFTGYSAAHQPEQVVAVLNQYLALATQAIFDELGTLDKFLGDGVMAIFGAPMMLPNHEMAAIRAALAMRARLDELQQRTNAPAGFGIGIHSGEAIVGNIGTTQLMNYTAIGDVVNLASRLQTEARSGEVLISDATLARVRDHVRVESLGPVYVKNRSEPVGVFKVIDIVQ